MWNVVYGVSFLDIVCRGEGVTPTTRTVRRAGVLSFKKVQTHPLRPYTIDNHEVVSVKVCKPLRPLRRTAQKSYLCRGK